MRHTLAPRKRLGQHFLADDNTARKIARAIDCTPDDVMVEIGAGEGALTRHLIGHVKRLYAVEIDPRAVAVLRESFGETITLVEADALRVSFRDLAATNATRIRIVGNIPYQITSPLLFHVFEHAEAVRDVTFMIQREVAERIVAAPRTKAYGVLSVLTRFYGDPHILFMVPPTVFFPRPAVTSAVVSILLTRPHTGADPSQFRRVVHAAFSQRRKMLSNSLRSVVPDEAVLESLGEQFDLTRRAEELSVGEFVALTQAVHGKECAEG